MKKSTIVFYANDQTLQNRQLHQELLNTLSEFHDKSKSNYCILVDFDLAAKLPIVRERIAAINKLKGNEPFIIITPYDALHNLGLGVGFEDILRNLTTFSDAAATNILRLYEVYYDLILCHIKGNLNERAEIINEKIGRLGDEFDNNETLIGYYQHIVQYRNNLHELNLSQLFGEWPAIENPTRQSVMLSYATRQLAQSPLTTVDFTPAMNDVVEVQTKQSVTKIDSNTHHNIVWCQCAVKALKLTFEQQENLSTILLNIKNDQCAASALEAKTFLTAQLNFLRNPDAHNKKRLYSASIKALQNKNDHILQLVLFIAKNIASQNDDRAGIKLILAALKRHQERFKKIPALFEHFKELIKELSEQGKTKRTKTQHEALAMLEFLNNPSSKDKQQQLVAHARKAQGHTRAGMRKIGITMLTIGIGVSLLAGAALATPLALGTTFGFLQTATSVLAAKAVLLCGTITTTFGVGLFIGARRNALSKEMRAIEQRVTAQQINA